ncbi:MAG: FAD binding domain-containing protein, partial [Cyclobacteriaceae bacterium]|nr:FAD binding domain-containing protein [Cyclobacteriaceae bacterium]
MNKFSWYDAKTVDEALRQADTTVSAALTRDPGVATIIKSGGTDVLDFIKEGLVVPARVVNIRNIKDLNGITYDPKKGLRIGANATLSEMEGHADIKANYLAIHQATAAAATPQLRNMATLGGNLAQRTRCWYFRSIDHKCLRKDGDRCFARHGENQYHSIMRNGSCVSVHSSSVATALMAFGARVEIVDKNGEKKEVEMDKFFIEPLQNIRNETILKESELITAVIVPP